MELKPIVGNCLYFSMYVTKALGMTMLIRSMAPKVIVADEIGNKDEVEPIMQAVCSGIKGVFTAHGASLEEISINPTLKTLLNLHIFERIIFLSDKQRKAEIQSVSKKSDSVN